MGFWPGRFDLNQTNGTLARGGACRDWVLVNRALTDAQNFGDAFLARPTLAQRINLTAILIFYSPVLVHRQPLAISRGYPIIASLDYALDS